MPRLARLDAPGAVHHVMARGIEKRAIFADDADRDDFIERVAALARAGAIAVYAWSLMPNHFHLLLRTGNQPLERSMRSLLSGYAGHFNRRHERVGHLLQNRYKSVLVQEERYLLKLVHYIHRNPIPKVVPTERRLVFYPYTGHSAIVGTRPREWQDVDFVLGRFAPNVIKARRLYRAFIRSSLRVGDRDLDGGGLVRSADGWKYVKKLRNGRERFATDERILGCGAFVEDRLRELAGRPAPQPPDLDDLVAVVARAAEVSPAAVWAGSRSPAASNARAGVAYLWVERFGQSARRLARHLGLAESTVHEAVPRGRTHAASWDEIFPPASVGTEVPKQPWNVP